MAVNSITITQSNVSGANNYLAIHSPLVFFATANVTGTAPETLTVYIKTGSTVLSTYSAFLYASLGSSNYSYLFRGERAIRQQVSFPNDVIQVAEEIDEAVNYNLYRDLNIEFKDIASGQTASVSIVAYNAAKQVGEQGAMLNVYSNTTEEIYCFAGRDLYTHYNKLSTGSKTCRFLGFTDTVANQKVYRILTQQTTVGRYIKYAEESGTLTDWFMPSVNEVIAIYNNLYKNNIGGYTATSFWCCSEDVTTPTGYAMSVAFGASYSLQSRTKTSNANALPVRTFESAIHYPIGGWGQYGWVFHKTGNTYYEAAPVSLVAAKPWGANGVATGVNGTAIGTGKTNTSALNIILAGIPETGKASQYCAAVDSGYTIIKSFVINVLPNCTSGLFVKFLDSATGYYKHWLFSRYYSTVKDTENIGEVMQLQTSLSVSPTISLGMKSNKKFIAVTDGITQEMLDYLSPIFTSPRIAVYNSSGVAIPVTIDAGGKQVRWGKNTSGSVSITFDLGEQNNVTML